MAEKIRDVLRGTLRMFTPGNLNERNVTAFFVITEAPSHVKFCKGGDPHLYTKASNWLFCDYFSN